MSGVHCREREVMKTSKPLEYWFKYPPDLKDLKTVWWVLHFLLRYRKHPEVLELFLTSLKDLGIPEAKVSNAREAFETWRETYLTGRAAGYRADLYLTAGMGAVDLVLLNTIVPMGVSDQPLFLATLMLAVSLVFVGVSLFISFARRDVGLTTDSGLHSWLMLVAYVPSVGALTATFWHVSSSIGVLFLALAVLVGIGATVYLFYLTTLSGFRRMMQALREFGSQSTSATDEPQSQR
jgi:hypothetical protein